MSRPERKRFYLSIFFIILLAVFLRSFEIDRVFPGFFTDEAAIGYNAYKIVETGKDEYGKQFPLFFQSYGDYRLPIPIYLNAVTVKFFGLSEQGIRLTAAFIGVIGIFFAVLLATQLVNWKVGVLTGFLLAISPWHIHMSRWGSEYIYFVSFFTLSFYLFLKAIKTSKAVFFISSFFVFGLTMYTYYAAFLVVPLFIIVASSYLILTKRKLWRFVVGGLVIYTILCIPFFFGLRNQIILTRLQSVNKESFSTLDKIGKIIKTYRDHFTLDFLFLKGDIDFPGHFITRHSVRGFGEAYIFQLPFLIIGILFSLFKRKLFKGTALMIFLFLIFPLGSSVVNDGPMATRSVIGVLPLSFFSAVGINRFFFYIRKNGNGLIIVFLKVTFLGIIALSFFFYSMKLFVEYRTYSANFWGWQFGFAPLMHYFRSKEAKYDAFLITHQFNGAGGLLNFYKLIIPCEKCDIMPNPLVIHPEQNELYALRGSDIDNARKTHPTFLFTVEDKMRLPNGDTEYYIGRFLPQRAK